MLDGSGVTSGRISYVRTSRERTATISTSANLRPMHAEADSKVSYEGPNASTTRRTPRARGEWRKCISVVVFEEPLGFKGIRVLPVSGFRRGLDRVTLSNGLILTMTVCNSGQYDQHTELPLSR